MSRRISLDQVYIPQPCPKPWKQMTGDAKVRFCNECQFRVFNLSEMTRDEAQTILDSHPDRLCVCYRPTKDGAVRTLDYQSPRGKHSLRWWVGFGFLGALGAIAAQGLWHFSRPRVVAGMIVAPPRTGKIALPICPPTKTQPAATSNPDDRE